MDQNKKKQVLNFDQAKKLAKDTVALGQKQVQQQKSIFENLMKEVEDINPALGGFEELGSILSLSEESFALIGPIFLDELQKSLNNTEDKIMLIQSMNVSNTKLEDLMESYNNLVYKIDSFFTSLILLNYESIIDK